MSAFIDVLRDVLDHEIVDVDGVSCGSVDEVAFEQPADAAPQLAALLVGPGAWTPRLPALFAVLAVHLFGRALIRVPWSEVAEVGEVIKLKCSAGSLGLGKLDRKASRWLKRLPKS
jgi:sporulation protein YlmC with PRC-barrel domain